MVDKNTQEIIKSTNVEYIINQRNAAIKLIEDSSDKLRAAKEITDNAGLGDCAGWVKSRNGGGCLNVDDFLNTATKEIDSAAWQHLMSESGMRTFMDTEAKRDWDEKICERDVPELTLKNVISTFEHLLERRGELFERGVINIYKGLSWDYKTNSPCKFGKRIILDNAVSYSPIWGFSTNNKLDTLADLERIMAVLEQKPEPDHRENISQKVDGKILRRDGEDTYENDEFIVRWYKKGTMHVTFKQPGLIEKLNAILAKHYPEALPPKF